MADFFKNLKANELISAIICMALGIVLIIWPGTSVKVACMILGGALLLYGVLQIILYLFAKERTIYLQGMLLFGIVLAVIGAWILLKPESIMKAVPVIVGIIIVIYGINNAVQSVDLKKLGYGNWWIACLLGLATIVLGAVLIFKPFGVINTVTRVIGGFLIYDGLSDLWILSRLFKAKKNYQKIVDVDARIIDEDEK